MCKALLLLVGGGHDEAIQASEAVLGATGTCSKTQCRRLKGPSDRARQGCLKGAGGHHRVRAATASASSHAQQLPAQETPVHAHATDTSARLVLLMLQGKNPCVQSWSYRATHVPAWHCKVQQQKLCINIELFIYSESQRWHDFLPPPLEVLVCAITCVNKVSNIPNSASHEEALLHAAGLPHSLLQLTPCSL